MEKKQPKIYVAEDNLVYQALIVKQLESITGNIDLFTTGESFLASLTEQPDLVILDYNLDSNMTGYDILSSLKESGYTMPVIFFSANPDIALICSAPGSDITAFIEKTVFSLPRLKQSVEEILHIAAR